MVRKFLLPVVLAAVVPVLTPSARAAEATALGVWQQVDPDTGRVGAYVTIEEHDGVYEGTMTKLFLKPDEDQHPVCGGCKGDMKDHSYLGLRLISGLKRDGRKYEGGTIVDPRDGTEYSVQLKVSKDNQTLEVRGFIGISLLGQSQEWKRLPKTAAESE